MAASNRVIVALICGGALLLAGCRNQAASNMSQVAVHAAPPVPTQMREVNSNSHIPAAQKALIESHMSNGNGIVTDRTPATTR